MIQIRRAEERGHFDHGWLDTYHTFSFARYIDREHMGFRALRVINEDWVAASNGFGEHGHDNMEIITYVLSGALEHRDSLGNGEVLRPGEVQHMSAGTGIRHSEFNHSTSEPVHLYQIWLLPREEGLTPGYSQKQFPADGRLNRFQLVASPDGADESLTIQQDARISLCHLTMNREVGYDLDSQRHAWLQVLRGGVKVNGSCLNEGDGAAISDTTRLTISAPQDAELLLFDLA
ncbi:pirin family protein [Planctomicrobium sp. SH664]|uniref:pirin family protein n=1 Tax=Planctomicrobium sp. SH664 TaxID=3448125 RepID=UPI003F5AFB28